jgi:hypothetical protein
MTNEPRIKLDLDVLVALLTLLSTAACGSGGGGGSGGAGQGPAGSGGPGGSGGGAQTAGTGGPGAAGAGAAGTGTAGGGGAGTGAPTGMACEPKAAFTLAIHIVVNVSWEGTLGSNAGSGAFHLWNLAKMTATATANGLALTGMTQPCGNTLPELTLKPLVGGGMALVEVPDAVWDLPSAPKFATVGTLAAWTTGSALVTDPTIALVGVTLADPDAAWPASYTMLTPADVDGDGNPGITGIPRTAPGYVQTPVSTPLPGYSPRADKVFLASRTGVALSGTLTSCTEQAGTVSVKYFDNHIVGCHVSGGDLCTPTQTNFIDSNRTKYTVTGATFTSKFVKDDATCADARAM